MKTEATKLLDELVTKIQNKEEFAHIQEQLLKRGVEALLNAEMTAHLGYSKGDKPHSGNLRNLFSEKTLKIIFTKRIRFNEV